LRKGHTASILLKYKLMGLVVRITLFDRNNKHVKRVASKVQLPDNEYRGGAYAFDKTFYRAAKEFKAFAKELWTRNILN
jgi:hypothetical protein